MNSFKRVRTPFMATHEKPIVFPANVKLEKVRFEILVPHHENASICGVLFHIKNPVTLTNYGKIYNIPPFSPPEETAIQKQDGDGYWHWEPRVSDREWVEFQERHSEEVARKMGLFKIWRANDQRILLEAPLVKIPSVACNQYLLNGVSGVAENGAKIDGEISWAEGPTLDAEVYSNVYLTGNYSDP